MDMPALPPEVAAYKRTATFTESTVPAGLLRDHRTKAGVWGRIVVEAGELAYVVGAHTFRLGPGVDGIVAPQVTHHVAPVGSVRFHVVFLR
jgi:tellurite resistance-related uncharacterized protein